MHDQETSVILVALRQTKNFNQNNFLFDLGQRDWSRICLVSDVDEKWNEWENKLMTYSQTYPC